MPQLEHIEAIEARLWRAADLLRANSELASNEYFLPTMGLIFLRHAYSRYLAVKPAIEAAVPRRGGVPRALTKEDFSQKGAIFLRPEAQFDYFVSNASDPALPQIIVHAMEMIETDYESLRGVLPKQDYQGIPYDLLGDLIRTLNPDELKNASGDVFGRIYEYFLTKFADLKAHDNGEFFTPVSLVSFIANLLEPSAGTVFDPACGSGGMFVQSAHIVERRHESPAEKLTFKGLEKNNTTIDLAKMNLAVHGLEGDLRQALTYYADPLELRGRCDYVMANPPFNVDEVDAGKIENDPRLPFGLPGVTTAKGKKNGDAAAKGRVQNANYLWIQYFYSYLNARGRAGFVMSSQASSAGRDEAKVRRKLIETGRVDVMVAIRSNFFYTRTVPCELWFLDKAKPAAHADKVLMLDARGIYRKVTRKIYDFSPEQMQNLLAIVWLYRGERDRFRALVAQHFARARTAAAAVPALADAFIATIGPDAEAGALRAGCAALAGADIAKQTRDLAHQADQLFKAFSASFDGADNGSARAAAQARKTADEARHALCEQMRLVRYFHHHAAWLTDRFPDAALVDVPGLVKLVSLAEIEQNDWSLTPGRYVGIAPEEVDDEFDFEQTMRDIHAELAALDAQAAALAATIARNFEDLLG